MAYVKQTWADTPSETTPISAARLAHMETQYDEAVAEARTLLPVVTPEFFGAVGDGVSDDTTALQAFFDYLGANGGRGTSSGTYRTTTRINILDPTHSASYDGLNSTTILTDFATSVNAFSTRGLNGWGFRNFRISATPSSAGSSHGMSNSNAVGTTVEAVTVSGFTLSAVMFFRATGFAGEVRANNIVRCRAEGQGVARNGFFHEGSEGSTIRDCIVNDLAKGGAGPGYALQLKNNSKRCSIIGGSVNGAVVGVAFGYELPDSWAEGNVVTGVSVRDCTYGFLGSRMRDNSISITVDMSGAGNLSGIHLAGNAIRTFVTATVSNMSTGTTAVYIQDDSNVVNVPVINGLNGGELLSLAASADNNSLSVGRITGIDPTAITTIPLPELGSNSVTFDSETRWVNIPLENGWAPTLSRTPQVKRIGNTVYMRGQIADGTATGIGTIPSGFRPRGQSLIFTPVLSSATLSVAPGGALAVTASGIGGGVSLSHSWSVM